MSRASEDQPFLKYSDDPAIHESDCKCQPTRSRRGTVARLLPYAVVVVVTSLLWVLILLLVVPTSPPRRVSVADDPRHNVTSGAKLTSCGNSTEEARARGCKYDVLLNNWVPAPCFDQEWVDEYLEDNSWGAYADKNMTQRLSVEEMSQVDS